MAEVQVLVWEASWGASYSEAVRAMGKRAQSAPLQIKSGGEGSPPSAPAVLEGLSSLKLGGPAPGTVNFNNFVPGQLDIPIKTANIRLEPPFVAQLWANGEPVTAPAPFGSGGQAGYWQPVGDGTVILTNVQAGDLVTLQLKVWGGKRAKS